MTGRDSILAIGGMMPPAYGAEGPKANSTLREAAQGFEAVMLKEVFEAMRRTVPESSMTGGGFGTDVFTDMLDESFVRGSAEGGGLGLADLLVEQLGGPEPQPSVDFLSSSQAPRR